MWDQVVPTPNTMMLVAPLELVCKSNVEMFEVDQQKPRELKQQRLMANSCRYSEDQTAKRNSDNKIVFIRFLGIEIEAIHVTFW